MIQLPWMNSKQAEQPFMGALVLGCARSGTSILGELIGSHPDVEYAFESYKIWEGDSDVAGVDESHRLTAEDATDAVRRRIRGAFWKRQRGRGATGRMLVEKSPRNTLRIPFLRAIFPEAKLIHIIRDGRDVACSLVPGMGEEWLHLRPAGWRSLAQEYKGIVRCAVAWREIVSTALDDLNGVPHLEIRYEEMLHDPVATGQRIVSYLELPGHPAVAEFARRIQDKTDGSYQAQFQEKWFRDNHARRMGRWRENMTSAEQAQIHRLIGPLLKKLNYATDAEILA